MRTDELEEVLLGLQASLEREGADKVGGGVSGLFLLWQDGDVLRYLHFVGLGGKLIKCGSWVGGSRATSCVVWCGTMCDVVSYAKRPSYSYSYSWDIDVSSKVSSVLQRRSPSYVQLLFFFFFPIPIFIWGGLGGRDRFRQKLETTKHPWKAKWRRSDARQSTS